MAKKQIPFVIWVMIVAGALGGLFALTQRGGDDKPVEQASLKPPQVLQPQQTRISSPKPTAGKKEQITPTPLISSQNQPNPLQIAAQQTQLERTVRGWQYQGFMALGSQKIGKFSRNEKDGGDFRASEGDTVEEVKIVNLTQNGVVLQLGDARVKMSLERPLERVERAPQQRSGPPRRRRQEDRPDLREPATGKTGVEEITNDPAYVPIPGENESSFRR